MSLRVVVTLLLLTAVGLAAAQAPELPPPRPEKKGDPTEPSPKMRETMKEPEREAAGRQIGQFALMGRIIVRGKPPVAIIRRLTGIDRRESVTISERSTSAGPATTQTTTPIDTPIYDFFTVTRDSVFQSGNEQYRVIGLDGNEIRLMKQEMTKDVIIIR